MGKNWFSEEEIIRVLGEQASGGTVAEVCHRNNISEQTFYRWKSQYGGMTVSEARRLRALEQENSELKKMVAEQALDVRGLKAALSRKN
jgi:putative transposase